MRTWSTTPRTSSSVTAPRAWPIRSASRSVETSWPMKAFVEATPISGPACVITRPSRLARDRRSDDVAEADRPALELGPREAHGGDRVGGLARLADRDDRAVLVQDRAPVPELRRVVDLDRDPRELLEEELRDEAGVPRGPARDDRDAIEASEVGVREPELVEDDEAVLLVDAAEEVVRDDRRLLVDLLEHEVVEAAPSRPSPGPT